MPYFALWIPGILLFIVLVVWGTISRKCSFIRFVPTGLATVILIYARMIYDIWPTTWMYPIIVFTSLLLIVTTIIVMYHKDKKSQNRD